METTLSCPFFDKENIKNIYKITQRRTILEKWTTGIAVCNSRSSKTTC